MKVSPECFIQLCQGLTYCTKSKVLQELCRLLVYKSPSEKGQENCCY